MASRAQEALAFFTGLGLSPAQAAGFVGNLQQESGPGLDPTAIGDKGRSFGVAQFQGPRREALNAFAESRGTSPADFRTQLDFIAKEFQTTERPAFQAIQGARTPQQAAQAAVRFFRPSDPRTPNRVANAMRLAGLDPQSAPRGILASETPQMANGTPNAGGGLLGGALDSPLFNLGIGLLAASGPSTTPVSTGQALGQGVQFAQSAQKTALRNQLVRSRLEDDARRRAASQKLTGLLGGEKDGTLGLLAEIAPDAFAKGLLGQMFPQERAEPADLRTMRALGIPVTPEGFAQFQSMKAKGELGEPMSITDLNKIRMPDGSTPPLGTTAKQAAAAGATVMTAAQQKAFDSANKLEPVFNRLEELALGPDGAFIGIKPGLPNRAKGALDLFLSSLTRDNPNVAAYESFASGVVAPIIRQFGEVGALSDSDRAAALSLLPQIRDGFLLPDTQADAREKLDALVAILQKGATSLQSKAGGASRTTSPPANQGGFKVLGVE